MSANGIVIPSTKEEEPNNNGRLGLISMNWMYYEPKAPWAGEAGRTRTTTNMLRPISPFKIFIENLMRRRLREPAARAWKYNFDA